MSKKVLVDLAMKLSANSAELRRGLDESRREMRRLNDTANNMGRQMTMAFAKITAGVVAARQGLRQMNDVMNSTMTTADRMRRVTDGLDGSMQAFNRAMATGDFSGFTQNLRRAYQAAAEFSDVMDHITKSQMALSIGDINVARQIFELDQIIYGEEQMLNVVQSALDEKTRIYREHYTNLEEISERSRDALMNNIMRTHNVTMKTTQEAFEYFTRFNVFDQAREEAQKYFDIIDRLSRMGTTQSMNPSAYTQQDFKDVRFEAERVKDSLQGWARWLVDNNTLIEALTPSMQDLIEVEKNYQQTLANRERVFAQIAREQYRISRRFSESAGSPGDTAMVTPDFWGGIDMGHMGATFSDRLAPIIQQEQEAMEAYVDTILSYANSLDLAARANEIYGDSFDHIGAQMQATRAAIDGLIAEGYTLSDGVFDGLIEKLNELEAQMNKNTQQFNVFGGVAAGASSMIAASFMDLAMGVEQNIEDIIKNLMRMIGVQMLSNLLMGIFAPGAGAGAAAGILLNPGGMSTGFTLNAPGMAKGGIAYGPSIIEVGEYPGSRLDPEIISRASDLRRILGVGERGGKIDLYGRLDGRDIMIANERSIRDRNLIE